jgi:hypothetical protein
MKPRLQEKVYSSLYRTWLREALQADLAQIPNKDCFMEDLRELINDLKQSAVKTSNVILQNVYQKTIQNIQYMVSDLLKAREQKILKETQLVNKIDEKLLFSMEKAFYRQIYSAFKGYSKTNNLLMEGILTNGDLKHIQVNDANSSQIEKNEHKKETIQKRNPKVQTPSFNNGFKKNQSNTSGNIDRNQLTTNIPHFSTPNFEEMPNFSTDSTTPQPNFGELAPSAETNSKPKLDPKKSSKPLKLSSEDPKEAIQTKNAQNESRKHITPQPKLSNIEYITLRITHHVEPLVGEDMKIYGPFKPGNLVFLPKTNAQILIDENYALALSS